jgi:hypothetical protein
MFNEVKKALLTQILGYLGIVRLQKLKSAPFLLVRHAGKRLPELK